jgi:transcriptional regulator with GAF, ATPase, and Fis domain
LDIRIIAATNRNLEEMVKREEFREDLWFRLNVFPIRVPPLRERTIDIPALIQHFISLKAKELKLASIPSIAPGAIESAMNYRWPGNVRELQNVIERALILNPQGPLTFDGLGASSPRAAAPVKSPQLGSYNLDETIARHISRVLQITSGRINGPDGAAQLLGVNPSTLRNRMKKLKIDYGRKT